MTKEEMDELVERVSRNVYNIVESFGWYYLEIGQDDDGWGLHQTYLRGGG